MQRVNLVCSGFLTAALCSDILFFQIPVSELILNYAWFSLMMLRFYIVRKKFWTLILPI